METKKLLNKKITQWLLLVAMLVGCSASITAETIYYSPTDDWVDGGTVKYNGNNGGAGWKSGNMTKTKYTYHGRYIYSATFSISYGGLDELQLQLYQGSTWKYECKPIKSYTTSDQWNNKLWSKEDASSWIDLFKDNLYGDFGSGWKNYDFEDKSVTINLKAGTYSFKVHTSDWYGINNDPTMTRNSCSNWNFYSGQGNVKMTADVDGDYTFKWSETNKQLTITYPTAYTATAQVGTAGGGKVSLDGGTASSTSVSKTVASGTTVTFAATASTGYNFKGWGTSSSATSYESTNNPYNVTISANKTLYAIFEVACTDPSPTFTEVSAVYNGNESPWKDTFTNDHRSAVLSTSLTGLQYQWVLCNSDGTGEVANPTVADNHVTLANATTASCTATFDLPGTYYFKLKAGCSSASASSKVLTVNVPYPEMGISGPLYNGGWNHGDAGNDGPKFTRDGLVYTNTFNINQKGEFVIIQRYKLGCEANNGWDGYDECGGSAGNKINASTLTNDGGFDAYGSGNNFTTSLDVSGGSTVKITVTMTGYDSYTIKMEKICVAPTDLWLKGPLADGEWVDPYNTQATKNGNVFTFSLNAKTGCNNCGGQERQFCIATAQSGGVDIRSMMDNPASGAGWSWDGTNYKASSDIVQTDNTPITITVTYNPSTCKYSMVLERQCVVPTALWIKGPLVDGKWNDNYNTQASKSGNVYTFSFNAKTGCDGCGGQERQFCIATAQSGGYDIRSSMSSDGKSGWDWTGSNYIETVGDLSEGTPITITVTYRPSTCDYTMTLEAGCRTPTDGFGITGQLNSTAGYPWAGTKDNPANGGAFGIGHNTATLEPNIDVDLYQWHICDKDGNEISNTNVTLSNSTSKTATATFKLPGEYYFYLDAKCSSDANYKKSVVLKVNVPHPTMRIEGPIIDGGYYNCFGTADSKGAVMGIWDHTWYKEFIVVGDVVNNNYCFRVGEQYLYNEVKCTDWGADGDYGWSSANSIHQNSTVNNTLTKDGDHFAPTGSVKRGDKVKVEVVMNDITASGTGVFSVNLIMVCSAPTAGFDITGQLNAGQSSPWAGSVADGTQQGEGGCFGDGHRNITLTSTVGAGHLYNWVCTSSNSANVSWNSTTGLNAIATVSLPGTYTFKQQAKCTDAPDWVDSDEITVVVPFPAMRVEGIIVGGKWVYDYDKSEECALDMDCNEATYTWTKEFKAASGDTHAFRIGQENKKGAGWTNANADILGDGQTIATQGDCSNDNNAHFDQTISNPVLAATEKVKVTVIMNAYNNYTVKLERLCGEPYINSWTIPTTAVCEGTEHTIIAEFHSDFGPINSYTWSATGGWTPAQSHTEGYSNTFTAGSSNGIITVTAASRCDGSQKREATSGVITTNPLPNLALSGSGSKSAAATYPWEYMTVTATTDANLSWNDLVIPDGIGANDYVYEQGATANVKQLKSKQTTNANEDKFVISATATDGSGCSTTETYNVYINAAPAEVCQ